MHHDPVAAHNPGRFRRIGDVPHRVETLLLLRGGKGDVIGRMDAEGDVRRNRRFLQS